MLSTALAHAGLPLAPHDLWWSWNVDPLILMGLALVSGGYLLGRRASRRPPPRWRSACFAVGLAAVAVALVSPLDALSGSLASAHMVQHVLLILVAAPALAASAPMATIAAGIPSGLRRTGARWRGHAGLGTGRLRRLWAPPTVWLLHVAALWTWHASVLYGAALDHEGVHALEHATMLGTALLFWGVVAGSHGAWQVDRGQAVLLVFLMAMQSVLLSVLLTFAGTAWYGGYAETTAAWGLEPLADQRLAGVIMWVPASALYLGAVLFLLLAWLREADSSASLGRPPSAWEGPR